VLAAFFFAYWDVTRETTLDTGSFLKAVGAAALFCVVSSAIYVINDIRDAPADRKHPKKKNRPVAAGRVSTSVAWPLAIGLLAGGLACSWPLSRSFFAVVVAYTCIQAAYNFGLKQVALLDIMVIAAGFVLRAIAGAVVLEGVVISPWLLLCTFLLALFLALCKRRQEKILTKFTDGDHRKNLGRYDQYLLDQLISTIAGATIVCYSLYTLWPDTVGKFNTHNLGFTIPFVIFGLFRYLDLVYRHKRGERPEKILLTDAPTLVNLLLYVLALFVIFAIK
jgi:4-hydroxybenzoate polyprenyltransferase